MIPTGIAQRFVRQVIMTAQEMLNWLTATTDFNRTTLLLNFRCNGSMFVHLPFLLNTRLDDGDEHRNKVPAPEEFLHRDLRGRVPFHRWLFDQAYVPLFFISRSDKKNHRPGSKSLANDATRIAV